MDPLLLPVQKIHPALFFIFGRLPPMQIGLDWVCGVFYPLSLVIK
jgi:hypothetical protein